MAASGAREGQFVIVAEFEVRPEGLERFLELAKVDAAQSVAKEPGCHQFDVTVERAANRVLLYEVYDDEAAFEAHGYEVGVATSDWLIGRGDRALQLALLDGWLEAALEIAPESRVALTSWHERRRAHVLAERSSMNVGHMDLVGWL